MQWRELRPGLWLTDSGPQTVSEIDQLRRSLRALVESARGPIALLFDASGFIPQLSVGVVRGYIEILDEHQSRVRCVYVASESAMVRFAASSARLALKDRLVVVANADAALAHFEDHQQPALRRSGWFS